MNVWSHSNLRLPTTVDRVLRYLVVTPNLHLVHHSAWKPETNSNFGAVFPFWDLVFGTFHASPRDGHQRMRIGLDEVRGREAHRPLWLLGSVFSKQLTSNACWHPGCGSVGYGIWRLTRRKQGKDCYFPASTSFSNSWMSGLSVQ